MKTFVILKPSAISGLCVLGEGATVAAAWTDAYGPKPWPPYTKKSAKGAWAKEVDETELADLHEASANR